MIVVDIIIAAALIYAAVYFYHHAKAKGEVPTKVAQAIDTAQKVESNVLDSADKAITDEVKKLNP